MPSTSKKQQHLMQMAMALKRGHRLEGVSKAGKAKAAEVAKSMSETQLTDFMKLKKGAK